MLRLNASFSKKVPAEAEYSSQSYHCAVEAELPDGLTNEQIQEKISATFELCRRSVEAELRGEPAAPAAPQPAATPRKSDTQANPASPAQIKFLKTLAARHQLTPAALVQMVGQRFGVQSVEELTKKQASSLIDDFTRARAA